MGSSLWRILIGESWLWNPGFDILAVESLLWNPGYGLLAVENPDCDVLAVEASKKENLEIDKVYEENDEDTRLL